MDITIITYKVTTAVLAYCFALFLCWLIITKREGGKVSSIYLIVMGIFAARFYGIASGIYVRGFQGTPTYGEHMQGLWWDTRLLPESLLFIVLAVVLTRRFVKSYLFRDPEYKAQNGNRKDDH